MSDHRNVFTNAKQVAVGYDRREYLKQSAKRGDPGYVLTRSDLCMILSNAKKWKEGYREDEGDTKATKWGNLIDAQLLDSARFDQLFAIQPSYYNTTGMQCPVCKSVTDSKKCAKCKTERVEVNIEKEWSGQSTTCQDWKNEREREGRTVISKQEMEDSTQATIQVCIDANCSAFIEACAFQVYYTAEYHDKATGIQVLVKTLPDLVPNQRVGGNFNNDLGDLKTTRNATSKFWNDEIYKRGYAMQAAMCLDVHNTVTGDARQSFCHVISENVHPYYCELRRLSLEFIELGRAQVIAALSKYAQCVKTSVWPGYHSQVVLFGVAQSEPAPWMVGNVTEQIFESQPAEPITEDDSHGITP